jgi:hypothetical protein
METKARTNMLKKPMANASATSAKGFDCSAPVFIIILPLSKSDVCAMQDREGVFAVNNTVQ